MRVGGPVALRHLRSRPLPFLERLQSWRSGRAGPGTMVRGLLWSSRLGNRTEPLCRRPQAWVGAAGLHFSAQPPSQSLWTGTHSPGEGRELPASIHLRCSPASGNVRVRVSSWVPAFRLLGAHPRVESPGCTVPRCPWWRLLRAPAAAPALVSGLPRVVVLTQFPRGPGGCLFLGSMTRSPLADEWGGLQRDTESSLGPQLMATHMGDRMMAAHRFGGHPSRMGDSSEQGTFKVWGNLLGWEIPQGWEPFCDRGNSMTGTLGDGDSSRTGLPRPIILSNALPQQVPAAPPATHPGVGEGGGGGDAHWPEEGAGGRETLLLPSLGPPPGSEDTQTWALCSDTGRAPEPPEPVHTSPPSLTATEASEFREKAQMRSVWGWRGQGAVSSASVDLPSAPERGSFVAVPSVAQPFIGAGPLRATLEGRAGCCPVPGSERLSPSQGHPASLSRTSARRRATPHVTSHSLAQEATRTVSGNRWRSGLGGLSPPAPSPPGPRHDLHACIHTHSCKREAVPRARPDFGVRSTYRFPPGPAMDPIPMPPPPPATAAP